MNKTRWRPDTCSCTIDIKTDDDGQHTFKTVKACPIHQADGENAHVKARDENYTKNLAMAEVMKTRPDLKEDELLWSFNKNRQVEIVVLAPLTAQEKVDIQRGLDKLGGGKAKVK